MMCLKIVICAATSGFWIRWDNNNETEVNYGVSYRNYSAGKNS